jgi:hypothetical protein
MSKPLGNCVLVVCLLFLFVTLSAAQGKISSQWKCDLPSDQHSIAVPDSENHNYAVAQGKCTSEKGSMGDVKEQEGAYSEFGDMTSSTNQNHGLFVVTLADGDKVFYRYHGRQLLKSGKIVSGTNTWTLAGGTGKYKAVKGEGSCKGKGNMDGTSTWNCQGSYSGAQ